MKIETKYNLMQEVKIKELNLYGVIECISIDMNLLQYRIVYWNKGDRENNWLYEFEIEKKKK